MKAMKVQSLRTADARDFTSQAVDVADVGDADVLMFPENGVAVLDTGMDLGHADFAGRAFVTNTPSSASRCKTCTVTARIASASPAGPWPRPCPMPHAPCPPSPSSLTVASVLAEIGVVSGQCASIQATALRKVAGVADMSPDAPVNPGPPD